MDHDRFDDLTRSVATGVSRRQAIQTIVATTIGGLLGLAWIGRIIVYRSSSDRIDVIVL